MTTAQQIAESAGWSFPRSFSGIPYTPRSPMFARFGKFSLYLACCIAEANARDIHSGIRASRFGDPIATRIMLLADALLDANDSGSNYYIGLELNLNRFISDVIHASRRDPDAKRRAEFEAALYTDVADQFDKLRLTARARDYRTRARLMAEAMEQQAIEAAE